MIPIIEKEELDFLRKDVASRQDLAYRSVLLFFDPVIPHGQKESEPYEIIQQRLLVNGMAKLRDEGQDTLGNTSHRPQARVGRMDLVLIVPDETPRIDMMPSEASPEGREMTPEELNEYSLAATPGFRTLGWTGTDIPARTRFGVDLVIKEWARKDR